MFLRTDKAGLYIPFFFCNLYLLYFWLFVTRKKYIQTKHILWSSFKHPTELLLSADITPTGTCKCQTLSRQRICFNITYDIIRLVFTISKTTHYVYLSDFFLWFFLLDVHKKNILIKCVNVNWHLTCLGIYLAFKSHFVLSRLLLKVTKGNHLFTNILKPNISDTFPAKIRPYVYLNYFQR